MIDSHCHLADDAFTEDARDAIGRARSAGLSHALCILAAENTIEADRAKYVFMYGRSENDLQPLGEGETRYLSTEVAGGFTGAYVAMYSSGNGAPCTHPADFDWFDYRERDNT